MSTTIFNGVPQCRPDRPYDRRDVGKRTYNEALGAFWRDLRKAKKLKLRQAAQIAANRDIPGFTKSTIEGLEKGTHDPSPEAISGAALIYGEDYGWLVSEISRLKYGTEPVPRPEIPSAEVLVQRFSADPILAGVAEVLEASEAGGLRRELVLMHVNVLRGLAMLPALEPQKGRKPGRPA